MFGNGAFSPDAKLVRALSLRTSNLRWLSVTAGVKSFVAFAATLWPKVHRRWDVELKNGFSLRTAKLGTPADGTLVPVSHVRQRHDLLTLEFPSYFPLSTILLWAFTTKSPRSFCTQKSGVTGVPDKIAHHAVTSELAEMESASPQPLENIGFVHPMGMRCHQCFVLVRVPSP
jgi:hypothetical protein